MIPFTDKNPRAQERLGNSGEMVLFTHVDCPYSRAVRQLLDHKEIAYTDNLIDEDPQTHDWLKEFTGQASVPYIFISGQFIGGYEELKRLDEAGKLAPLLRSLNDMSAHP